LFRVEPLDFIGATVSRQRHWVVARHVLFAIFLGTAALNMLHVRGGFLTNHAADLFVPAWLYVVIRGLGTAGGAPGWYQRTIGRTPGLTASFLFVASALTEVSQLYWPRGVFAGRFDPLDLVAYGVGLVVCYFADRFSSMTEPS
jgi:hypothetical protein